MKTHTTKTNELVSVSQYAAMRGVTPGAVNKAIRAGKIPLVEGGKLNPAQADVAWNENRYLPQRSKMAAAQPGYLDEVEEVDEDGQGVQRPAKGSFAAAQLRHQKAKATLAELEVKKAQGKVIDADEASHAWGAHIAAVQSRLLLLPSKLAPKVAPLSSLLECQAVIDREIRAALVELSGHESSAA
jgi:phage terminase Nu1 subunit (DNA packaging protein)